MLAVAPPRVRLTPRPYQQEAVAAVLAAAARGVQRPLVVLPTGTGKTILFALLVQRRAGRALILAHRDELIQQAVDKFHLVDPTLALGVVQAAQDDHEAPTVMASVQTLSRRARLARHRRPSNPEPRLLPTDDRARHAHLSRQDRLSHPGCCWRHYPTDAADRRHPVCLRPDRIGPAIGPGDSEVRRGAHGRHAHRRDAPQHPRRSVCAAGAELGAYAPGRLGALPGGAAWYVAAAGRWRDTWQVMHIRRDVEPVLLGDLLPLAYAQGLAEDFARHLGLDRWLDAEAPWRRQPASDKQTALLQKLGVALQPGLTKGQAADLLSAVLGDWD